MKLIAIIGSPKGMQGYTGSLVDPMLKAAQQEGIATEIFSLAELTVLPCKSTIREKYYAKRFVKGGRIFND